MEAGEAEIRYPAPQRPSYCIDSAGNCATSPFAISPSPIGAKWPQAPPRYPPPEGGNGYAWGEDHPQGGRNRTPEGGDAAFRTWEGRTHACTQPLPRLLYLTASGHWYVWPYSITLSVARGHRSAEAPQILPLTPRPGFCGWQVRRTPPNCLQSDRLSQGSGADPSDTVLPVIGYAEPRLRQCRRSRNNTHLGPRRVQA